MLDGSMSDDSPVSRQAERGIMSHQPIAYTYDADYHCRKCAAARFGTTGPWGMVIESAVDREGNKVHAVMPWDEWHEPTLIECQTLNCGTCFVELDTYRPIDAICDDARRDGEADGEARADWYFDGNTRKDEYARVLKGIEDGDPAVLDTFPTGPLSGEWAGDLTPAGLLALYGMTADDDEADSVLYAYEDGWNVAVEDTIEAAARLALS